MNIKEILHIKSFSAIIGHKQPEETCPMIDNHISDLNLEISDWNEEIEQLEKENEELESSEEDNYREIANNNKQIERLQSEIYDNESKIKYFEQDRRTISCTRDVGRLNRESMIDLFKRSLIIHNSQVFICTQDILKENIQTSRDEFKCSLNNSYSDVSKNYEKIVDWTIAWTGCGETILNHISTNIIKVPIAIEDLTTFSVLIPKITKSILENEALLPEDQKIVHKLFPEQTFFENDILNIESIKEEYFHYLF